MKYFLSESLVAVGQNVTVNGAFFDDKCKVYFDDEQADIVDVTESSIVVRVPDYPEVYSVRVVLSNKRSFDVGRVVVVSLEELPVESAPKAHGVASLCRSILSMFPRGNVFDVSIDYREPSQVSRQNKLRGSVIGRLVWSMAFAISYLLNVVHNLFTALDPVHTSNFSEWEADYGIPLNGCTLGTTDAERRRMIHRLSCTPGGNTVAYFQEWLDIMGIKAKIYEYYKNPEKFSTYTFDDDDDKNFFWMIEKDIDDIEQHYATCESTCEDYLEWFDTDDFEALFLLLKPAHTRLVFSYVIRVLVTPEGNVLTNENGEVLRV